MALYSSSPISLSLSLTHTHAHTHTRTHAHTHTRTHAHDGTCAPFQMHQYQNCNGYPSACIGANNKLVGHEAAQGLGAPMAGQCEVNPLTGEWWSLPAAGRCSNTSLPGENGCTWRATRVKTIDSKCLFTERGFADLCRQEARAPFAKASAAFRAAFLSSDPTNGGCPALPGPGVASMA